jgi:pimeloyl-ACP methyl ester carboxylesterase
MSATPHRRQVDLPGGRRARVLEMGEGEALVFLGGLVGLPRWPAILDQLAAHRRVIAPSLPGFHGCELFRDLDHTLDWITSVLDLLDACAPEPVDLLGASLGATLAAEAAAMNPSRARRLALISPFGLFRAQEPTTDIWAQRKKAVAALVSNEPASFAAFRALPEGEDEVEWTVLLNRSQEAAARLLWPMGDTGLERRLHRIVCPTLLLWGDDDRVVPASYAKLFSDAIRGTTEIRSIEGAGHMAELDRPDAVAQAVLSFID